MSLFLSTTDLDDNFEATQFIYHLESESDAVKNSAYRSTILLIAYPENEKKLIHFLMFKDSVFRKNYEIHTFNHPFRKYTTLKLNLIPILIPFLRKP